MKLISTVRVRFCGSENEICGKTFKSANQREALKIHKRRMHLDLWPKYKCEYCDKTFPSYWKRDLHHAMKHETNPEKRFVCHVCGKDFIVRGSCRVHIIKTHGEKAFESWVPPPKRNRKELIHQNKMLRKAAELSKSQ